MNNHLSYNDFLETKETDHIDAGFDPSELPVDLFDFQKDIVGWACRRGRSAIFADTGLGKTAMQLSWADQVVKHTGGRVLVLAPLCVAQQTVREGLKFGIDSTYIRAPSESGSIHVANYEMLGHFDYSNYSGIVLDESSILKGMNGKVRKQITDFAKKIPYRLSCTATPSPNDFMELGTQCEFLGVMSQIEMLATYFIHDGESTSKWRLKGHGRKRFWEWLSTWAVVIRDPGDLGYPHEQYALPPLVFHEHVVETEAEAGDLFVQIAEGLQDRNKARRNSVDERCRVAGEVMKDWDCGIAWCNLNDESVMVSALSNSCEITGSMDMDKKEKSIVGFSLGEIKKITTKPKIAGFGLNWQHCNKMVFVGLSDSFESFYQAIRRCWRFGQTEQVDVHIVISDREGAVLDNIKRKQRQHDQIAKEMADLMRDYTIAEIKGATLEKTEYSPTVEFELPSFMRA